MKKNRLGRLDKAEQKVERWKLKQAGAELSQAQKA